MAMENRRQIVLIAIAVVAGIGAAGFTGHYVTDKINQKTQELHDSYVAQQKEVTEALKQQSQQQMASLQQEISSLRQDQQQALQQATASMRAQHEQQQQEAKTKHSKALLTAKTPPGKRAVTVMIDSLAAVGGLLNAGDYVDVIAHLNVPGEGTDKGKTLTAMVFQNLQVLAINTNLNDPGAYDEQQSASSLKVTFAVDPQESGLLAFANNNGKLELALRAPNENDKQMVQASTWKTLADYALQNQGSPLDVPSEGAEDESDQKPYIQIFRGGKEL